MVPAAPSGTWIARVGSRVSGRFGRTLVVENEYCAEMTSVCSDERDDQRAHADRACEVQSHRSHPGVSIGGSGRGRGLGLAGARSGGHHADPTLARRPRRRLVVPSWVAPRWRPCALVVFIVPGTASRTDDDRNEGVWARHRQPIGRPRARSGASRGPLLARRLPRRTRRRPRSRTSIGRAPCSDVSTLRKRPAPPTPRRRHIAGGDAGTHTSLARRRTRAAGDNS